MDTKTVASAADNLLLALFGEKYLDDENFVGTSLRIAKAFKELLSGEENTDQQIQTILSKRFPTSYDGSICCSNHKTYSMCPHHLLPVTYIANIIYMPKKDGYVVGASKLGRTIDVLAKRAVLQETLMDDIINTLDKYLQPRGIGLYLKGFHQCMSSRGLKSQGSFETLRFTGVFKDIDRCRNEALFLFNKKE